MHLESYANTWYTMQSFLHYYEGREPIRDTYMYDFVAWTTNAKIPKFYLQNSSSNLSMSETVRIGSLTITCRNLIHFAAKTVDGYNNVIKVIHELTL